MAVAEPFRRRGVASSLLRAVDEQARAMGVAEVCLFVETTNRSAIRLYLKAGYNLVPYSPQATAFASAIGLSKGPLANRESFSLSRSLLLLLRPAAPARGRGWRRWGPAGSRRPA